MKDNDRTFKVGNGPSAEDRNTIIEVTSSNHAMTKNTVYIGTGLTASEEGEIVIGNGDKNIRLKKDGRFFLNENQVEVDGDVVKEMSVVFKQVLMSCLDNTKK